MRFAFTAFLVPALALTACGQTGPLYLPDDDSTTVVTRTAEAAGSGGSPPTPAVAPGTPPAERSGVKPKANPESGPATRDPAAPSNP